MLKFILFVVFLIPFCWLMNYWLICCFLFLGSFLFFVNGYVVFPYCNIGYYLCSDVLSFGLILLSFWICSLMLLASGSIYDTKNFFSLFLFTIIFLLFFLMMTFISTSFFMFYFFFESSLIPTFFLILGWGYQPERVQAGVYLLFYTLFASLPLLLCIFNLYYSWGSLNMFYIVFLSSDFGMYMYIGLILAFLVKMPMFIFHLWLPKAHVEAPISGSMILAGVLLKLGGYGLLRVFSFLYFVGVFMNFVWVGISLVGGVVVSLLCLRQVDLKSLIAYSSVAHMGIVLAGLMTMSFWGLVGAYTLMIAHGLCSSGMFCLANISYERLSSRSLLVNKGLINFMPSMCLWWFLLSSSNMAAPPTLNLLGEISLLNSIVSWSWVTMFSLGMLSFFSAAYTLYLYSYSQHGKIFSSLYSSNVGSLREYLLLFLHWIPLNVLILKVDLFFCWL